MGTVDEISNLDEIAAKRRIETDSRRMHELQIIHAELQSLHKGARVCTRCHSDSKWKCLLNDIL